MTSKAAISIMLGGLLMLGIAGNAQASTTSSACSRSEAAAQAAATKAANSAAKLYSSGIPQPNLLSKLHNCLKNLFNPGWGFSFGNPSGFLNSLMSQACSAAQSAETQLIGQNVGQNISIGGITVAGVHGGMNEGGGSSPSIQTTNTSDAVANQIWNSIR